MRDTCQRVLLVLAATTAAGACVRDPVPEILSATKFCEEIARLDCHAYYDCFAEDMRATVRLSRPDIGTTKQQCETALLAKCAPTAAAPMPVICPSGEIFQMQNGGACVRALEDVSCSDWLREDAPAPAACTNVCLLNPV